MITTSKILIHFTVNKMVKVAPPDPLHIYYGFQIVVLWGICWPLRESAFFLLRDTTGVYLDGRASGGGWGGREGRNRGRENYKQVM